MVPELKYLELNEFEKSLPHHEMVFVEGGEFLMGDGEEDATKEDGPVHLVNVESFYIGRYPVTQALFEMIMKKNPAEFKGKDHPVEGVSWDDAKVFIEKLNKETRVVYRLPSEAEWEFAARGGILSEDYLYAGSDKLHDVAWYRENSDKQTHPIGQKAPNELGLFDMSGNVLEWCEDDWHDSYQGAPGDGKAWVDGVKRGYDRVLRGGSWINFPQFCRSAYRGLGAPGYRSSNIGFRLVLSPR